MMPVFYPVRNHRAPEEESCTKANVSNLRSFYDNKITLLRIDQRAIEVKLSQELRDRVINMHTINIGITIDKPLRRFRSRMT
jgi:hypothetical protein